jgi:hypothetical protein
MPGSAIRHPCIRPARRPVARSRLVYRDEIGYYFDQTAQGWRALQPPTVSRGPAPFDVAVQLGVAPGDEAVIRDRIMGDPETGRPEAGRLGLAPGVALLRIVRLARSPAGRPLEINDTRMSGDEFEICYPLSRDPSALRRT